MKTDGTLIRIQVGDDVVLPEFRVDGVPMVGDYIHSTLKEHKLEKALRVERRRWVVDRLHYNLQLALVLFCVEDDT